MEREREICQALIQLRNEEENAKEVSRHAISSSRAVENS